MNYRKLEKNIIDVIKEQQAKLGYMKEKVRLYYPLSSLNHFFGTEESEEGMRKVLDLGVRQHAAVDGDAVYSAIHRHRISAGTHHFSDAKCISIAY